MTRQRRRPHGDALAPVVLLMSLTMIACTPPPAPTDVSAPVLTVPERVGVTTRGATGAIVSFVAGANDAVDGVVPMTCAPTSGSVFPVGTTSVNCSSTDAAGNSAQTSFDVTVSNGPLDYVVGPNNTCARYAEGGVKCWGSNNSFQLGVGGGPLDNRATPVDVAGLGPADGVAIGPGNTCVIVEGGVKCWGQGAMGQLGNGGNVLSATPVSVTGVDDAVELSLQNHTVCARLGSGVPRCWGYNYTGQVGDGNTMTYALLPAAPIGVTGAVALAVGDFHSCALLGNGRIKCWGSNYEGQLGNGTIVPSPTAVEVAGISDAVAVSAGSQHTCALLADRRVACWGRNGEGELGNGTQTRSITPAIVAGITGVVSMSARGDTTCAAMTTGVLKCWGGNQEGQVGDGSTTDALAPRTVGGLGHVVSVVTGSRHTCAKESSGALKCWGYGRNGQLGQGVFANSISPVEVVGLP